MAIEKVRRSGYRVVGGRYLCSNKLFLLDPVEPLPTCKYCGQGPKLSRNMTRIQWGPHEGSYIMIVGKHFYPTLQTFIDEANELGVSKRIPFLARPLVLDSTRVYLAHPSALKKDWGLFAYFVPNRVEELMWQSDYDRVSITDHTLIPVPDGDLDHSSWKEKKLRKQVI